MKTLQLLISNVRNDYLEEASEGKWTNDEIARRISEKAQQLGIVLAGFDEGWFDYYHDFSVTASTTYYDLPPNVQQIIDCQIPGTTTYGRTGVITARNRPIYALSTSLRREYTYPQGVSLVWRLHGNQIEFLPAVTSTTTVRMFYTRKLPKLHYGTAQINVLTGQIILASSATAGEIGTGDDYYNGAWVYIAATDELREITDYAAGTKIATVGTAFGSAPSSSTVYTIMCELPDEWMPLVEMGAAIRLLSKSGESEVRSLLVEDYNTLYASLVSGSQRRQIQEFHTINPAEAEP